MNKKETVAIIRSLLSSTKSSYNVSSLCKDFRNETGIDIPLFGYQNIHGFLNSIPDTVKVTGVYPAQQVHLVTDEKSAHIVSLVQRQRKESKSQRKKTSLLNNNYYSRGQETIDNKIILEYKKESHSFLSNEEKEFVKIQGEITIPPQNKISQKTSSSTSSNIDNGISILDQVLGFHQKILPIDLSLHAGIGEYVEVCLCKIYNPYKFFLHFRKNKKKLSHLMNELQLFYEYHEAMYEIPKTEIKPHQTCVALHKTYLKNYLWYRSEITEVLNNHQVIINLIDFGIAVKTSTKKLRLLHLDFSALPRQAISGSLANIKPLGDGLKWSNKACERFCDLASGRDLVAGVVEMNNEVPYMSVALSFTKDIEIHVNDTLVKEGFATFENISLEKSTVQKTVGKLSSVQTSQKRSNFSEPSSENLSIEKLNNCRKTVENKLKFHPIFYEPKNDRLRKMFC